MAKSLRQRLNDALDLVEILGLTNNNTLRVDLSAYDGKLSFHLDPIAFVKAGRRLGVSPKNVTVDRDSFQEEEYIHLRFTARTAEFSAVLRRDRVAKFYEELGEEPMKRLTKKSPALFDSSPKRLAFKSEI